VERGWGAVDERACVWTGIREYMGVMAKHSPRQSFMQRDFADADAVPCIPMLLVGRACPSPPPTGCKTSCSGGAPGRTRPTCITGNIGMHRTRSGASASCRGAPFTALPGTRTRAQRSPRSSWPAQSGGHHLSQMLPNGADFAVGKVRRKPDLMHGSNYRPENTR